MQVLLKQMQRTLGGMEGSSASGCVVPGVSEDSVDIYDDLDVGVCSNAGKLPPAASELRESLDLYEDMVAEEQLGRESSYAELKSKLQAAQNQIQGLRLRLEQMETQNAGLSKENHSLKKNISALLRTARQEVTRKDAEIQKLTQRAERGRHHHPSNIKRLQDLNPSSRTSTVSSISNTAPLPPSGPPPHPSPQSKENHSSGGLVQPSRNESSSLSRSSEASSHDRSKRDTEAADRWAKQRFRDKEEKRQKLSESTDGKHPIKDSHEPKDKRSNREDMGQKSEYQSRINTKHISVQGNCQSGVAKTSSKDTSHILSSSSEHKKGGSQDQRPDKVKTASVDHNVKVSSSRESSEHRNIKHSHKHEKHSRSKSQKNSSLSQDSERSKDRPKDHQRKKDHETSRRHHKSSSHPKTSREHDKPRHKDGRKEKVDPHSQKRPEKPHKRSSEEPVMDENSPNRKLCFMETLNLTLSPNKKPSQPTNGNPDDPPVGDTGVENKQEEEDSQINIKDMCVIDEVDNSELDSGDVPEMSKDNLKATSPESWFEDLKDVQGEDRAADSSVQIQSLDTAEKRVTVHPTPEPLESNSLKMVENSESYEDRTVVVTNCQATVKSHPSSTSENICEHISPRNTADMFTGVEEPHRRSRDTSTETTVTSHSKNTDPSNVVAKKDDPKCLKALHVCSPRVCQQDRCSPSSTSVTREPDHCGERDGTRFTDSVSSTTSLDLVPKEGLSLTEAIYVLTQTDTIASDGSLAPPQPSPGCIGVSKVSSTTEEQTLPETHSLLTITPKKSQTHIQGTNLDMSSPVSILHDEDSMMRTLSSLRRIPDAISPLRSPVQITKRSLIFVQHKPGHVKSLQKDFSTSAADPSSKKVDVNKENKYPGSPSNCEPQNMDNVASDVPLNLSDTDLEEGEILSESDEASGLHAPATKKPKQAEPVRVKASPSSVLRRRPEERRVAPKQTHEATGGSTPSPRSRFKTVCPAASSASFSTIEEIMETFKLVRTQIRKKYMKLHKTFPKKSFYGVMDNFQKSFFEFVDGANFSQICCQPEELKSKLKKQIGSVFSKLLNNGIVKRIFEQQAADLKQRLWDFVDVQVDYLFMDINGTLKSLHKPAKALADDRKSSEEDKESRPAPVEKPQSKPKEPPHPSGLSRTSSYRTGLGSRGKDIRITSVEKDIDPPNPHTHMVNLLPCKNLPQTPEKRISSLLVSQNSSVLDKTDFELLTEQQASSLTYNLVRDSQMGEIFQRLLQGSDLLDGGGIGDGITWTFGTPRKDEERFLSITTPPKFISPAKLLSPTKFDTPHKLLATWNSISPRRVLSPQSKAPTPLNPAVFDESCLLEIPSDNRVLLQASQKSYSILAEDLAVSLTLPSPLKSDSHLSFLQTSSVPMVSTPDSIISAHISEDALLGEEDATEQDIHLILDTDNSRSGSSSSVASETLATPFVFNSDVPMRALVTEKSNDHFIVKIQHANTSPALSLTANENLTGHRQLKDHIGPHSPLPSENHLPNVSGNSGLGGAESRSDHHVTSEKNTNLPHNPPQKDQDTSTQQNPPKDRPSNESENSVLNAAPSDPSLNRTSGSGHYSATSYPTDSQTNPQENTQEPSSEESQEMCSSEVVMSRNCSEVLNQQSQTPQSNVSDPESEKMLTNDSSSSPGKGQNCDKIRKRKKPSEKVKAKRPRNKDEESPREMSPRRDGEESKPSPSALSPSSLSAKNVVRKKGEVVIAWTRDEDRAILVDLKKNGASRETFSVLSEKLNKPSGQIAHRFYQLMKLFKKQKTDSPVLKVSETFS